MNISQELYTKLCNTLTDFENSTDDFNDDDYLSDGEWLDEFYNLCVQLKNDMEVETAEVS